MGYCCGYISGNLNLITSRRLGCAATAIDEWTLSVPITESGLEIIWFFKATNASLFSEVTIHRNQTTAVFSQEGTYKVVVQSADGSAIVQGTIPCEVAIIPPIEDDEEVKARRVNTKAELIALKDAGLLVNPCIYYVVSENKHYYADTNNNFADSTTLASAVVNRGAFKDDFEAASVGGLINGEVYEVSDETNYNLPSGVLKVVKDL